MERKKFLAALIILSLFVFTACSKGTEKSVNIDDFLIKEGVSLTCAMDELAESEEYLTLMTSSEAISSITAQIGAQDYSIPENVYIIELPVEAIFQSISDFSDDLKISESVMQKLKSRVNGVVFANMINATYGSEIIAATSMMAWGKSYIQPEGWTESNMLILEYPGDFSSIVSFVESGDGVISGSSVFVKNGEYNIIETLGEYLSYADIKYEHYSASQLQDLLK